MAYARATVNDPRHASLERDCIEYLESRGLTVASLEYHNQDKSIAKIDTPPAHLIRTRADRHAFDSERNIVLKFDAKTSNWKTGQQFAIEAIPYIQACSEAILWGVPYVFACRRRDGAEFAIRAGGTAINAFDKICLPDWRRSDWSRVFEPAIRMFGLQCDLTRSSSGGSGDAFLTVNADYIEGQPHWRETFDSIIEGA